MLDKGFENRREGIFVLSDKNPLANFSDSLCVCGISFVCRVQCVVCGTFLCSLIVTHKWFHYLIQNTILQPSAF